MPALKQQATLTAIGPSDAVNLSRKKIKAIVNDPKKTAAAINLVYVQDSQPGIHRLRKGNAFEYYEGKKKVRSVNDLQRIKSLVIPPAWEQVWICGLENGHLQATGLDVLKRKQYRYHPAWNALRNQTKFFRMSAFGESLPAIRKQLSRDLSLPGLPLPKVLALIVSLMETTNIRVGNNFYEKLYGSFGLTTLKDKHVTIKGNKLSFSFKGKKGVVHDISIQDKKLSKMVQQCRDIPGKELFQYYDDAGKRHPIDSGMVNEYIKSISTTDFTAKDFRTWSGTVSALLAFKELGFFETATESKKKIVEALDMVSKQLGNTRTVCKKYYVHPSLINLYETQELKKYLSQLEKEKAAGGLTPEEVVVMRILEKG